ncbi:MAG: thioesterase [Lachnospiraceae bacterium]|nr:thioesterase [Lachnospiraceae bacterium]
MYSFESRVRYSEVEQNQELSVTGVINYLQDCSTFQSEDLKLGISYLEEHHRAWWLSSWQIVMERYPRLGEHIVVSTWPYDFKGMYGYRNFLIRDEAGHDLVKANSIWFFFDTEAGRPVKVGLEDIRGYGAGENPKLEMDYAPRRIVLPKDYREAPAALVGRHHIDTNHHVNNAQYVEIAREVLPAGIRIRELRVEYKKAAVLGDQMIPRVSRIEDTYTVALCDEAGEAYAVVWVRPEREN